jgi:hypothetical protein
MKKEKTKYDMNSQTQEKRDKVLLVITYRFKLIEGELYKRNASFGTFDNVSSKYNFKMLDVYVSNLKIVEYLKTGNFPYSYTNSTSISPGVRLDYKKRIDDVYKAILVRNGKTILGKRFKTKEEAIEARAKALDEYKTSLEKNI